MPDLKPCPFCGNEHPTIVFINSVFHWQIECPACDIRFRLGAGEKERIKQKIVDAWNRREKHDNHD